MQTENKVLAFSSLLPEDCNTSRESAQENENIFDCIGDLLFVIDQKHVIIKVNKSACEALKKKPEELIGKHCYEIVHGMNKPWSNCPAIKTFETKQTATEEIIDPNVGLPLLVTTSPILDGQGEVAKVIHIAKDITETKLAEMELHIAANLFDAASDSILVHDLDGRLVYFNGAAYKTRGYTREEFQGLSIQDLEVPENPRFFGTHLKELLDKGEATFETVNLHKDKKLIPVEIHTQIIESDGRKLVLSVARDISKRKEAELKLKESEEKHRILLNEANVLVQSVDANGRFSFVNEEWKKVLGFASSDLEKITITDLVRKDHQQHFMKVFNDVVRGACVRDVETVFVSKEGREIAVSGNVCPIIKDGTFISTVAFFVDITERKINEEKLRESSRRIEIMNEKLRVIGGLTRHDVRNKLSAVTGYAYILKKRHKDLADVVDGLSRMEQAVAESMKIFDFAKMYEQIGVEELTYINVGEKVDEAISLFSGPLPTIINGCKGLTVLADSFLRQLFFNFIDNSRKYGKKITTIRVSFGRDEQSNLKLTYEDDGVGVPFESKKSLFKEGFSTGGSTGYGLFLTRKMMDVYGWQIQENGIPGEGAKFTITIPKLNKSGKENYQTK
jgi:PAS domain S-box-containing protein